MGSFSRGWKSFKTSKHYHNVMMFLVFVFVSAIFWLIMTLNDNAQDNFEVKVVVENVPENVTFITDLPQTIHVNVRDKGSTLFRTALMRSPEIRLKFAQFAHDGVFKVPNSDLSSALRSLFGSQAAISFSVDSLYSTYTTAPGKKVRLIVDADVSPSFESSINARPYAIGGNTVTVYALPSVLDTITSVRTQRIVKHNLKESLEVEVPVLPIKGARIVPGNVKVMIAVEPLVLKRALVEIKTVNVPAGENLMVFPSKIEATYFAPMSRYEMASEDIVVLADYNEVAGNPSSAYIGLKLSSYPPKYINVKLAQDSVEYTIVKKG